MSRLNSGNPCYHSFQNLFSSLLLSKIVWIEICRITVLPFDLYGCVTWSLTLKEEHKLRVYENKVLGRILGLIRDEITGG
jgi:hypothetical protein